MKVLSLFLAVSLFLGESEAQTLSVSSPQGLNQVTVRQQADEFCYSVSYQGKPVVTDSRLGLQLDNQTWERALARNYPQYACWFGWIYNFWEKRAEDYGLMLSFSVRTKKNDLYLIFSAFCGNI